MTEYVTVWKGHKPTSLHWGVPVVRCRDCAHFACGGPTSEHKDDWCALHDHIGWSTSGFCAWGVPMEATEKEGEGHE